MVKKLKMEAKRKISGQASWRRLNNLYKAANTSGRGDILKLRLDLVILKQGMEKRRLDDLGDVKEIRVQQTVGTKEGTSVTAVM